MNGSLTDWHCGVQNCANNILEEAMPQGNDTVEEAMPQRNLITVHVWHHCEAAHSDDMSPCEILRDKLEQDCQDLLVGAPQLRSGAIKIWFHAMCASDRMVWQVPIGLNA